MKLTAAQTYASGTVITRDENGAPAMFGQYGVTVTPSGRYRVSVAYETPERGHAAHVSVHRAQARSIVRRAMREAGISGTRYEGFELSETVTVTEYREHTFTVMMFDEMDAGTEPSVPVESERVAEWRANAPAGYALAPVTLWLNGVAVWAYVSRREDAPNFWNGAEMPVVSADMLDAQADAFARLFPGNEPYDYSVEFRRVGDSFSLWCADDREEYGDAYGECLIPFDRDGRALFALGNGWTWSSLSVARCDECGHGLEHVGARETFAGTCDECGTRGDVREVIPTTREMADRLRDA